MRGLPQPPRGPRSLGLGRRPRHRGVLRLVPPGQYTVRAEVGRYFDGAQFVDSPLRHITCPTPELIELQPGESKSMSLTFGLGHATVPRRGRRPNRVALGGTRGQHLRPFALGESDHRLAVQHAFIEGVDVEGRDLLRWPAAQRPVRAVVQGCRTGPRRTRWSRGAPRDHRIRGPR